MATVGWLVHNCIVGAFQLATLKACGCNVAIVRGRWKRDGVVDRGIVDRGGSTRVDGGNVIVEAHRGWSTRVDSGNVIY